MLCGIFAPNEIKHQRCNIEKQAANHHKAKAEFVPALGLAVIIKTVIFLWVFPEQIEKAFHTVGKAVKGALIATENQQTDTRHHYPHRRKGIGEDVQYGDAVSERKNISANDNSQYKSKAKCQSNYIF